MVLTNFSGSSLLWELSGLLTVEFLLREMNTKETTHILQRELLAYLNDSAYTKLLSIKLISYAFLFSMQVI